MHIFYCKAHISLGLIIALNALYAHKTPLRSHIEEFIATLPEKLETSGHYENDGMFGNNHSVRSLYACS